MDGSFSMVQQRNTAHMSGTNNQSFVVGMLQLQLITINYYTAEGWPVHTNLAG